MERLPPSAKLVLKVILEKKVIRFKELQEQTKLPTRTLRYALRVLREKGLIKTLPCLDDARERMYSLYEIDECYKLFND
ncbi:winged helix-turn-helix transcriptional regulator [Saccharolobus islandicus]|nr:winged helix-turn-helix transcriptional regulator [Sulfolobus islandicus]ADX83968.1 transcriptional regulator [Sulfolobus islandicus HVE10/4]ADX86616.1 transcriptional regulator-like protein [Sulfolobus islandicus REY15A]WCM37348.1 winged helix-turn-helix transcriptional regulator [Sulfolobus islandicus]